MANNQDLTTSMVRHGRSVAKQIQVDAAIQRCLYSGESVAITCIDERHARDVMRRTKIMLGKLGINCTAEFASATQRDSRTVKPFSAVVVKPRANP